jgi:acyl-homoserine lactone acylase PvdQ
MKAELLSERRNLVQMCMGVTFGLIGLAALPDSAFAEKMNLGQIPKNVQEGWCNAHNGQYLDWGGAMYWTRQQLHGLSPKTSQKRIRQQAISCSRDCEREEITSGHRVRRFASQRGTQWRKKMENRMRQLQRVLRVSVRASLSAAS